MISLLKYIFINVMLSVWLGVTRYRQRCLDLAIPIQYLVALANRLNPDGHSGLVRKYQCICLRHAQH